MSIQSLKIARDFSRHPAGRYKSVVPFSGELCRQKFLVPRLTKGERLEVELDGTRGYGSSFLEEAFGGLVREEGFSGKQLRTTLVLKSSDSTLVDEIWSYIDDADSQKPPSE